MIIWYNLGVLESLDSWASTSISLTESQQFSIAVSRFRPRQKGGIYWEFATDTILRWLTNDMQEVDAMVSKCFKHFWQILTILATNGHDPEFQGWHVPSHDPESERVLDRSGCKIIRKGGKAVNPMILHHGSEVWIYGPSSSGQHPWVLPASKHKTSDKLYINMHHIHQWSSMYMLNIYRRNTQHYHKQHMINSFQIRQCVSNVGAISTIPAPTLPELSCELLSGPDAVVLCNVVEPYSSEAGIIGICQWPDMATSWPCLWQELNLM